ncbi:YbaB/EbfC family nucleoid-associated protein [Salininema proteolyticum]|uniref:YbaB/EbfC family nucleoid-associated protein n=1 Tax=Salininema proteolyticum TaxID=1607685 RepID=A0ABV8TT55_9ACTN
MTVDESLDTAAARAVADAIEVEASSPDRAVTVRVGPGHRVTGIALAPNAVDLGAEALAALTLKLIGEAAAKADERHARGLEDVVGAWTEKIDEERK